MCISRHYFTKMFVVGRVYPHVSRVLSASPSSNIRPYSSSTTSDEKRIQLGGIYPPLTTPFNKDETIAFDKLAANLTKYAKIPFAGYVVQGSNGEYPYLEKEERVQIVKFVKNFIKDTNKPLIAGSGCECKRGSFEF